MREGRGKIILIALAVAESCWLFAGLDVIGTAVDFGGSPAPWVAVLGLLGTGVYAGWLFGGTDIERTRAALIQGALGLVFIYIFMSLGTYAGAGFNLGWPARVLAPGRNGFDFAAAIVTFIFMTWLWRHAVLIGADQYAVDRLTRTFKVGIAVLAVAVVVEQFSEGGADLTALLIPFFTSALVGLAVGRLPEGGSPGNSARWAQVIAVSVLIIIGAGLLLGLAGGIYGSGGVHLLYEGWGLLVDGLLWVLRIPIAILAAILLAFLRWVFSHRAVPEGESVPTPVSGLGPDVPPNLGAGGSDGTLTAIVNIVQYPVLVIVIIIAFFVLALAFRRLTSRRAIDDSEDRESLAGEARSGDLARLLMGLLPSWLRGRAGQRSFLFPAYPPGITAAFRLYFDTLLLAIRKGAPLNESQTPSERVESLAAVLPRAAVRRVTAIFNAACYGDIPADAGEVELLRGQLEEPVEPGPG